MAGGFGAGAAAEPGRICYTPSMGAIVLAGGKSRRMGSPKADLRLGDKRLLEWVVGALRGRFAEILVVAPIPPQSTPSWARLVTDEPEGCGPLGALYAGLRAAREEKNFVAGCDTPFLRPRLAEGLMAMAEGQDVVVPAGEDGLHPLCGVYSRACLEAIHQTLEAGERRVTSFFQMVKVRLVKAEELRHFDPQLVSLFNINTPEEMIAAERLSVSLRLEEG